MKIIPKINYQSCVGILCLLSFFIAIITGILCIHNTTSQMQLAFGISCSFFVLSGALYLKASCNTLCPCPKAGYTRARVSPASLNPAAPRFALGPSESVFAIEDAQEVEEETDIVQLTTEKPPQILHSQMSSIVITRSDSQNNITSIINTKTGERTIRI